MHRREEGFQYGKCEQVFESGRNRRPQAASPSTWIWFAAGAEYQIYWADKPVPVH